MGPKTVVKADPNVDVIIIAITIIFECIFDIRISCSVVLPSVHRESAATRTRTACRNITIINIKDFLGPFLKFKKLHLLKRETVIWVGFKHMFVW